MNWVRIKGWLIAMAIGLLSSTATRAADIDLFAGTPPSGAQAPNVLILMDTGAAFSSSNAAFRCNISAATGSGASYVPGTVKVDGTGLLADFTPMDKTNGGVEQCALYEVFKTVAKGTATINIGVMFLNNNQHTYDPNPLLPLDQRYGTECANGIGGCLAMKFTPLNTANLPGILEWVRKWNTAGNDENTIKGPQNRGDGGAMQEAWAYINGKQGMSLRNYAAIKPPASCSSNSIIYLGNNWNSNSSPKDGTNTAESPMLRLTASTSVPLLQRATPTATVSQTAAIQPLVLDTFCGTNKGTLPTSEGKGASALNWAMYLRDQGITTYSIAVEDSAGNNCDATYAAWLNYLGTTAGGGDFFATSNFAKLVDAFKFATGKIASVNSVFAAVSLPVSVNMQGTYLNEIYVGMFRPGDNFKPRWNGNLKQYKLGKNEAGVLKMQDADGAPAINTKTGFIEECKRSFWTPNEVDSYWSGQKSGGCLTIAGADASNYPDGNIVEKGAQAYKLRNMAPTARRVKTCSTVFAECTTLTDFSTSNGTVTAALSNDLINWARGTNLDNEMSKGTTTMRVSSHGDVVHSRPIPVDHRAAGATEPSIVVYYGGNDGMLRAVNGNRGSATFTATGVITAGGVDYEAGSELWSFVPPEFYGNFERLRTNTMVISSPASSANEATQKKYGIDGPVTAFQGTIGGANKVYIYATMRRGGRIIYAFDVTSPTSPVLLWKKGCPNAADDDGCSTGYTGLGQTWSSLKTMFAAGYTSGATTPLLIFGGGYDKCEDYDALSAGGANHSCNSPYPVKGNKVYVVNAATGAVVKAFDTVRPVIADTTLVRDSVTGKIKHAYTADLGGNVYRINFGLGDETTWTIVRIASLGCANLSPCTANRKFTFAPSVVTTDNDTYSLFLGSGDREKPLTAFSSATAVTNYFFHIKDTISTGAASHTDTANCGSGTTVLCLASLAAIGSTNPAQATLDLKPKGWYLALAPTEQVVTSAITIFGVVTFSTHQPAGPIPVDSCVPNLGTTNVYNISYLNASSANGTNSRFEHVSGDGLPPPPVAGQVLLDDGTLAPFCIGCNKDPPLEGAPPRTLSSVVQPTNRLYWYIQK
jgi:type IV pilus assembly protein PilY1